MAARITMRVEKRSAAKKAPAKKAPAKKAAKKATVRKFVEYAASKKTAVKGAARTRIAVKRSPR